MKLVDIPVDIRSKIERYLVKGFSETVILNDIKEATKEMIELIRFGEKKEEVEDGKVQSKKRKD